MRTNQWSVGYLSTYIWRTSEEVVTIGDHKPQNHWSSCELVIRLELVGSALQVVCTSSHGTLPDIPQHGLVLVSYPRRYAQPRQVKNYWRYRDWKILKYSVIFVTPIPTGTDLQGQSPTRDLIVPFEPSADRTTPIGNVSAELDTATLLHLSSGTLMKHRWWSIDED